jgi:hypothetical protein
MSVYLLCCELRDRIPKGGNNSVDVNNTSAPVATQSPPPVDVPFERIGMTVPVLLEEVTHCCLDLNVVRLFERDG